jgi:hypothetical protein
MDIDDLTTTFIVKTHFGYQDAHMVHVDAIPMHADGLLNEYELMNMQMREKRLEESRYRAAPPI